MNVEHPRIRLHFPLFFRCLCLVAAFALLAGKAGAGTIVYDNDFSDGDASNWSIQTVMKAEATDDSLLGPFGPERIRLMLDELPEHTHLRFRIELAVRGPWRSGKSPGRWEMGLSDRSPLFSTSFVNTGSGENEAKQGFPAPDPMGHFAPGTGRLPDRLWDGPQAVYHLDLVMRHEGSDLDLQMRATPHDSDDTWAIRRMSVEAIEAPGDDAAAEAPADAATLDRKWAKLGTVEDASEAFEAIRWIVFNLDSVADPLVTRLLHRPDEERINKLISQLDDDDFFTREEASEALRQEGESIRGELEVARERAASFEIRARLTRILNRLETSRVSPTDRLRFQRVLLALRLAASDRAIESLETVASESRVPRVARNAANVLDALEADAAMNRTEQAMRLARAGKRDAAMQVLEHEGQEKLGERLQSAREVVRMVAEADHRRRTLEQQLDDDEADAAARRELVLLLLGELDDPAAAARAAGTEPASDEKLARIATIAAEYTAGEAPEPDELQELAQWYIEQAREANMAREIAMLRRATLCLEQVLAQRRELALDRADDDAEHRSSDVLSQLELNRRRLEMLGTPGGADWVDLLALVDIERDVNQGQWQRTALVGLEAAPGQFASITIPARPTGSYEMRVSFERVEGEDGIFIAIPAGDDRGNLNLGGWNSSVSGLERINGRQANDNATTIAPGRISTGVVHDLYIRVEMDEQGELTFYSELDGGQFITWQGAAAELSTADPWRLPREGQMGLGSHTNRVHFRSVEIRLIDGELEQLKR